MQNRHPVPMPALAGSPLEQARAAFDSLTDGPNPVSVDGRVVPGMAPRPVRLDEVRIRLRERGCPTATRDAIWAFLVHRARTDAGVWTLACVGCALPVLVQASRRLCRGLSDTPPVPVPARPPARPRSAVTGVPDCLPGTPTRNTGTGAGNRTGIGTDGAPLPDPAGVPPDRPIRRVDRAAARGWVAAATAAEDVEAAVLAGFLAELAVVDLTRPRVLARLRSAAHEAGALARREIAGAPIPQAQLVTACSAPPSARHPDLVLAHAVAARAITRSEAALIGSTRLEPISLAEVAVRRGQSYRDVRAARIRAERKLSVFLRDHDAGSLDRHTGPRRTDPRVAASASPPGRRPVAATSGSAPTTAPPGDRSDAVMAAAPTSPPFRPAPAARRRIRRRRSTPSSAATPTTCAGPSWPPSPVLPVSPPIPAAISQGRAPSTPTPTRSRSARPDAGPSAEPVRWPADSPAANSTGDNAGDSTVAHAAGTAVEAVGSVTDARYEGWS